MGLWEDAQQRRPQDKTAHGGTVSRRGPECEFIPQTTHVQSFSNLKVDLPTNKIWGETQGLQFSYLMWGSGGGEAIPFFIASQREHNKTKQWKQAEGKEKAGSCGFIYPWDVVQNTYILISVHSCFKPITEYQQCFDEWKLISPISQMKKLRQRKVKSRVITLLAFGLRILPSYSSWQA